MAYKMKRGRPPLPEEEKKSNSVRVRLTDEQLNNLKAEAEACGLSVSEYIRSHFVKDCDELLSDIIMRGGCYHGGNKEGS